ncbi:MAG TPA: hypothetical protein PKN62_02390 [bacterium]|nr:hypothetical protein [bacterium]
MRKILTCFSIVLSLLIAGVASADVEIKKADSAADYFFSGAQETGGPMGYNITSTNGEGMVLNKVTLIINIFLGLLGVIFLGLAIYSGFLWMTAGGKIDQVKKATDLLAQAVIGLVIILFAYAITYFIVNALKV